MKRTARPIFILQLRAESHVDDPIRALRAALKTLLRRFGLRVVKLNSTKPDDTTNRDKTS